MLKKVAISFQAIEVESLAHRPVINDLLVLTRAFLFPADRIAWLACLRAPWTGLSLNALLQLCGHNRRQTIWQCIQRKDLINTLATDDWQRLQRLVKIFTVIMAARQRISLRLAVESLWCQLGGPATLNNTTELEDCEAFFHLLQGDGAGESAIVEDWQGFMRRVSSLYATPDQTANSRLQLMTMHKAKGLEFDHVVLPGLGRPPRSTTRELLVWLSREDATEQRQELILAPLGAPGAAPSCLYEYISHINAEKQFHEEQRLLYVAVTRARKGLHLLGHVKEFKDGYRPAKRSLLHHLWPVVQADYQLPLVAEENKQPPAPVYRQQSRRLSADWRLPAVPAPIELPFLQHEPAIPTVPIEFSWAQETIRHIGTVVHRALQWIADEGAEYWDSNRVQASRHHLDGWLQQIGVPAKQRSTALDTVILALTNTLAEQRGRWILSN